MIQAIQTEYNGYLFRSRLEARWAVFFDSLGIKYEYEPEGYRLSDGAMYLPDFYLPESKSFFEVKGVMSDIDMHKITQFIKEAHVPVTIGYSDFTFQACENEWDGNYKLAANKNYSILCVCHKCHKKWFMEYGGYWGCQCCGEYDGDSHFTELLWGDPSLDYMHDKSGLDAIRIAKQARFEHGERPGVYCGRRL